MLSSISEKTKIKSVITWSKLTIETLEQSVKYVQSIVNFEHISHLILVFLLLTLKM